MDPFFGCPSGLIIVWEKDRTMGFKCGILTLTVHARTAEQKLQSADWFFPQVNAELQDLIAWLKIKGNKHPLKLWDSEGLLRLSVLWNLYNSIIFDKMKGGTVLLQQLILLWLHHKWGIILQCIAKQQSWALITDMWVTINSDNQQPSPNNQGPTPKHCEQHLTINRTQQPTNQKSFHKKTTTENYMQQKNQ